MQRTIGLALLLLAFFAMRLPSIGLLPLYSDEALGLWRAERVLEGSLTRGAGEGKPLHAWMIAAAIAMPGDDIHGARAAHVVAGALLLLALWDVTRRQVSPAAGWTAAALWIVLPFAAVFERTVTPDVPLAAAGVAVVACAFRVAAPDRPESRRWRYLLLLAGAAAMFVKMPIGILTASFPLFVPLAFPREERAAARARLRGYAVALAATVASLAALVAIRALVGATPVGFGVHELSRKVAGSGEDPLKVLIENVRRTGGFAWHYFGPLGTALVLVAVVAAWLARHRVLRVLAGIGLAWTLFFICSARNLSAHYVLVAVPFFVITMGWAVVAGARSLQRRGESRLVTATLAGLVVLAMLATTWPLHRALWTDPASAPYARTERLHYVEGDWSGYGFAEAAAWVDQTATKGRGVPVFVTLHLADYERLRRYASEASRPDIVQVQVERYTVRVPEMIEKARALGEGGRRVLLVVGSDRRLESRWRRAFPTALVRAAFPRPAGGRSVVVLELQPRSVFGSR